MGKLSPLTQEPGFLKAGFLGKNKSGKTYTATLLALGLHGRIGSKKPVAFFDTEGGSPYVRDMILKRTGMEPVGMRSRSLTDLVDVLHECEAGAADILIVDSITHPWRECCDSYMAQINAKLKARGRAPRLRMEFQDWAVVKDRWNGEWATPYVNAKLHIIICGRAGDVYEYVENDETGKKELRVTGTKMKTETEFGFEPSLLVEMIREQERGDDGNWKILHTATVIGDRFHVIDGLTGTNPGFEFFLPHVEKLVPGSHAPVDADLKTDFAVGDDGDAEFYQDRRRKQILLEEFQGLLTAVFPGQTKEEKQAKVDLVFKSFGTRSWTAVEAMSEVQLAEGYDVLKSDLAARGLYPDGADIDTPETVPVTEEVE
jgi:hypothetical protein